MKSILYVGATLMVGASIYGFVDYKQTSQKKEFINMYTEEKMSEPELNVEKEITSVVVEKKETALTNKTTETKKLATKTAVSNKKKAGKAIKKRKTFNSKMFSRGGLDDRFIEPKKIEGIKNDIKKTEEKL
jgi:hypothetical protein